MDTALEPKILKNSTKIESKLALFNMSNSMMSKNTQNEMKKVVCKKVKKDEDKKVSSVKTNREFCMTMVDKLYDVKEQMTDNDTDLKNYWNTEMYSKEDNVDDYGNTMDNIMVKAERHTMNHKKQMVKQKRKRIPSTPSTRDDNIQLDSLGTGKISDMVQGDEMMRKFWENQECTEGV